MANLLIIGKELPDSLDIAEAFSVNGRTVFSSLKPGADFANFESENIFCAPTNRASAISAHSFLLNAETKIQTIDEYLLIFDAPYFQSKFQSDNESEISLASDTMINNYLFFTSEILKRLTQNKEPAIVSFLLKTAPTKLEVLQNQSKINVLPTSNIVSVAQSAFIANAENFASNIQEHPYISVLLSKVPYGTDQLQNDKEIGNWLCSAFDSLKNSKHNQNLKAAATWNKVGTKFSSGFNLFK